MIIGTINASALLPPKGLVIKILISILITSTLYSQDNFNLDFKMPDFSFTPKVFHNPNRVLFNSRKFDLEVFIEYPKTELKSVSLFYKTDQMKSLIEIPFNINQSRYLFNYDPNDNPAEKITYFFVVTLNNGSAYATPVDSSGTLIPVVQNLVNPVEYYKQRAARRN